MIVLSSILQIGQYPLDPTLIRGGVEASVYGLVQEQSKNTHVYVIDIPRIGIADSIEEYCNVTIFRFRNPGSHQKDCVKRIKDIVATIRTIRPSICHIHGTGRFSYFVFRELKRLSIPLALTVHGLLHVEKQKALSNNFSPKSIYQLLTQTFYERRLLSSLEDIIVDTGYVKEAIKRYLLRNRPRMTVIPQGIDASFFHVAGSADSRTILSVGSISRRKGHLLLIKAFAKAADQMKDIQLVLCGVLNDVEYGNEIVNLIATLPCKDRIVFKINVLKEELQELYSSAHIFALHSQEESQGIVFAEAMAAGLPVVATNVGGIPYVVFDHETGILSDYGDIDSVADSILLLMSPGFDWHKMSDKCRITANSYRWEVISDRISKVYDTILRRKDLNRS
jgi:glycosyltransferase involved in cell wall biosynthesis